MASVSNGVRVGAVALLLGFCLAGPQALGVAAADTDDGNSSKASAATGPSARSATPGRRAAGRAAGAVAPDTTSPASTGPATAVTGETTAAVPVREAVRSPRPAAARAATQRQDSGATAAPVSALPDIAPSPVAIQDQEATQIQSSGQRGSSVPLRRAQPNTASVPAGTLTPAPAAVTATVTPAASALAVPTTPALPAATSFPGRPLLNIAMAIDRLLANASNWLTGLPASPVTTFAQGALDMIRRSLRSAVKGSSVTIVNKTDQTLVVQQDSDGARGGDLGDRVVLEPGQTATFSGYRPSRGAPESPWDVRLVAGLATAPASEATRMIIAAHNPWNGPPQIVMFADPFRESGKTVNRTYLAAKLEDGFIWDSWDALDENQACHCDAVDSGGPADGPKVLAVRENDSDDFKVFRMDIYDIGSKPTSDDYPASRDAYYCEGRGVYLNGSMIAPA